MFFIPFNIAPILPFFADALVGSVFIEFALMYKDNRQQITDFLKAAIIIGICIVISSIYFGFKENPDYTFAAQTASVLGSFAYDPFLSKIFLHLPGFLQRNDPFITIFKMGLIVCMFLYSILLF